MARNLSYTFPAGNVTDVCQLQTLAGAGNLTLNGNLANSLAHNVSFISHGYNRQISISSVNNLTAVNFTINGIQNGVIITETIAGPNAGTVYGDLVYDTITSITTNGAANAVSIGSGWKGFFLIGVNLERDIINYTLTLTGVGGAGPQFAVFGTLYNLVNNGITYQTSASTDAVVTIRGMGAYAQNYVYSNAGNPIYHTLLIQVGQSAATVANSLTLNFIQT